MKRLKFLIIGFSLFVLTLFFFPPDKDCESMRTQSKELIDNLQSSGLLDSIKYLTEFINDSTFKLVKGKSDLFLLNSGVENIQLENFFQKPNREVWWFNAMNGIGLGTVEFRLNRIIFSFNHSFSRKADYTIEYYLNKMSPETYSEKCQETDSKGINYIKLKEQWYLRISVD